MINDKAILVGVDGSHASYKATWWAANYAKHAGLTLQIVCAYSLPSYAAVSFDATYTAMGDDNAAHSDAQEILSKAKAIADEQGVEAATLIVTGDPASVFVELSRNYNLIVIGNRGKGGLAERLLGTTSSSLPAYAYCPIVVVPYTDDDGNLMHLNNTITKVAVGSDESKWGLKALDIAADFATCWGAELDVISAVPNLKGVDGEDAVMESYKDDLEVRIKPLQESHPDLKINKQIVSGPAVSALTKASYDHDVVVVGSRGRGGFTGLLLGSPARACCSMRSARCTWCHASMLRPRNRVSTPCRARPPKCLPSRWRRLPASRRFRCPQPSLKSPSRSKRPSIPIASKVRIYGKRLPPGSLFNLYPVSVLDGDVHAHRGLLHVGVLDRATLVDMAGDALLELVGILLGQTGVGSINHHLLLETGVGVIFRVVRAIHHNLGTLALTQRMFDGELAGQRGATGQRDLHQIARRELATILAELNVCAIVAERIPRTVLVTLNPQSLTHSCSFIFSRRRSGPSPCQRGSAAPGRSPASVDFSIMPLSYTGAHGFDRRTTRRYSLPYPRTSRNGHSDAL